MDAPAEQHVSRSTTGQPTDTDNSPLTSEEILRGRNEVQIAHGDCLYSLRLTRQGKLILTK